MAPPHFQFAFAKYDPARSYLQLSMNMRYHSNGFQVGVDEAGSALEQHKGGGCAMQLPTPRRQRVTHSCVVRTVQCMPCMRAAARPATPCALRVGPCPAGRPNASHAPDRDAAAVQREAGDHAAAAVWQADPGDPAHQGAARHQVRRERLAGGLAGQQQQQGVSVPLGPVHMHTARMRPACARAPHHWLSSARHDLASCCVILSVAAQSVWGWRTGHPVTCVPCRLLFCAGALTTASRSLRSLTSRSVQAASPCNAAGCRGAQRGLTAHLGGQVGRTLTRVPMGARCLPTCLPVLPGVRAGMAPLVS